MLSSTVPRILVAGTHDGVGKSLVVLGLVIALRKRGLSVSCCVTGQSLPQALVYSRITRRYARVLDCSLLDPAQLHAAICHASMGAEVVIIDGRGGLCDGAPEVQQHGYDADLAVSTGTPIVLVSKLDENSPATLDALCEFVKAAHAPMVAGIIANRVPLEAGADPFSPHPSLSLYRQRMDAAGLPPVLGVLPEAQCVAELPPAILSQEANSSVIPMQLFADAGNFINAGVNIDALLEIARGAKPLEAPSAPQHASRACRFAVSEDSCFGVSCPDNLDLLRHAGAELVPFSPLADSTLPQRVGGVYLTGAYLKMYGEDLSRNEHIRRALKEFADAGGVVYSEGAGTAFLCRSYELERGGRKYPGVGIIPADASFVGRGRSHFQAELVDDTVLGFSGVRVKGISLGDWALGEARAGGGRQIASAMWIQHPGSSPFLDGLSASGQSFSTFSLLHFGASPQVAKSLMEAAQVVEQAQARLAKPPASKQ